MTLQRRWASFVGMGCCIVGLTACGELFNARVNAADGSPSSDANASGNNAGTGTLPGTGANTGNTNTNTGNTGNTNTNTGNTNTNTGTGTGNTNTTTGNTNAPVSSPNATQPVSASDSIALQNGCTQAAVTYNGGAGSIITSNCATGGCHGGSRSPSLTGYSNALTGFNSGGIDAIQGAVPSMPTGGGTLTSAQKCTLYNWADGGYLQ